MPDSDWSNNNLAHVTLWAALRGLRQLSATFSNAKSTKVQDLKFWNAAAPASVHRLEGMEMAGQLDSLFRRGFFAKFEQGVSRSQAVNAMGALLSKSGTTLPQLGKVADDSYRFRGEAS